MRPNFLARNLEIADCWQNFLPSTSKTGIWPKGIEALESSFHSNEMAELRQDLKEIWCRRIAESFRSLQQAFTSFELGNENLWTEKENFDFKGK